MDDISVFWESILKMPVGSYRGEYMGVHCFEVDELKPIDPDASVVAQMEADMDAGTFSFEDFS